MTLISYVTHQGVQVTEVFAKNSGLSQLFYDECMMALMNNSIKSVNKIG